MSIIEEPPANDDEGGTQGVVLVVAGPNSSVMKVKPSKQARVARLYNYSSLLSLAKWSVHTVRSSVPVYDGILIAYLGRYQSSGSQPQTGHI
jgi:hypothetical protein